MSVANGKFTKASEKRSSRQFCDLETIIMLTERSLRYSGNKRWHTCLLLETFTMD